MLLRRRFSIFTYWREILLCVALVAIPFFGIRYYKSEKQLTFVTKQYKQEKKDFKRYREDKEREIKMLEKRAKDIDKELLPLEKELEKLIKNSEINSQKRKELEERLESYKKAKNEINEEIYTIKELDDKLIYYLRRNN